LWTAASAWADPLPLIGDVAWQPLQAQARRVAQALELAGAPLTGERKQALDKALEMTDPQEGVKAVQAVLDPLCLVGVNVNAESRVKVQPGPAKLELIQQGWRVFLVRVHNEAAVTAELRCQSPNILPQEYRSRSSPSPQKTISLNDVANRWLDLALVNDQPLARTLSGLNLEYRVLALYSRDVGKHEAKLLFDVGQGTQDLGFRNEVNLLFKTVPAVKVVLDVIDDDGRPTTGQFVIRDKQGRVYPLRTRRTAPDLFFHDQIYRQSGEFISLPPGDYEFTYTRGPEYLVLKRQVKVPAADTHREMFRLKRWIHLAERGWFSGDHHVHAAGCAHFESPTEGVRPEDMLQHILGEDLNVGCVLSWGPCWYYQKQFFEGGVHKLSQDRYLMRYDIEVSGFPSSHAGHLCLLRLKEDDYPNTERIEDWPSWDLPILKWGQAQGGVVGFSHSGWGLKVAAKSLPTLDMPAFDGIGANEYIVDVVHGACDFISAVDTPAIWELNIWYHTLNCGYEARISGETDFPCIYGERVGLGRSYIKMPTTGPLDYDRWVLGLKDGRSYVSDGLSHLPNFQINGLAVGEHREQNRASVLKVKSGEPLKIRVDAAAYLEEVPRLDLLGKSLDEKPYWHVERARLGKSRKVPVELIVNGRAVEKVELEADGRVQDVQFQYTPDRSSWIAIRIFPSSHTNPIFVEVDNAPIRASRQSAEWCLRAVDVCWRAKEGRIRATERAAAEQAYEVARSAYRKILQESQAD